MYVPVYQPSLRGNEKKYVNECLDSTWISSRGEFIQRFESAFATYIGVAHATSVCNGTVAIHLALLALGLGPGDEVIVPTLTYVASVNAIVYTGATPVFVDSCRDSWQMDPEAVLRAITPRTRAILPVHIYGHPANMDRLHEIASVYNLLVVEDCAEAFGARLHGRHVGGFGHIGAFSFFGSKTVTTGEGGMVVTDDPDLLARASHLKNQGQAADKRYWHDTIGYNYRMTNIAAAIGLAQMERADALMAQKLALAARYDELLADLPVERHRAVGHGVQHAYWMYSILVAVNRDDLLQRLLARGVETRPVFYPVHTMPIYRPQIERAGLNPETAFPVASEIAARGLNLPSWPDMSDEQIRYVVAVLAETLTEMQ
ncbi:MAG: DegT/DnrJ/EryC1/StrS family aminotransferase [Caldilineaceae bacterium]